MQAKKEGKMELIELLKEAYLLLGDVDKFGGDDLTRRNRISKWISNYEATQPKEPILDGLPATGDLQDILGDCPAGTNWASRPEYQSREA